MEWLTEPFDLAFQQRALIGGALASIGLSLVGTWVVVRGMSFLGDALVHGVIPGIALGVLLGFNLLLGAALAAVVMIGGINLVRRQTTFSEDTSIGLLFVGMLALGVILISRTDSYQGSLTGILFGDALGVTADDIRVLAIVAVDRPDRDDRLLSTLPGTVIQRAEGAASRFPPPSCPTR